MCVCDSLGQFLHSLLASTSHAGYQAHQAYAWLYAYMPPPLPLTRLCIELPQTLAPSAATALMPASFFGTLGMPRNQRSLRQLLFCGRHAFSFYRKSGSRNMSAGEARTDKAEPEGHEPNRTYLEPPGHIIQVASSSSLAVSDTSDLDELNASRTSVEQGKTGLTLLEGCVEDVALVSPIHLQELFTENLFPTSPVVTEKDVLLTPTSPQAATQTDETQRTLLQKYMLWGRLSGPLLVFMFLGVVLIIVARNHLAQLLDLLEHLPWFESFVIFIFLFTLISFPFGIGYIILNMVAGYLYGFLRGQLVVMVSVTVGFTVSFFLCRVWFRDYAKRIVTSNALQAIMRVVEGKSGMKVIILTRLTPIPFGLQNALFSVSVLEHKQVCLMAMYHSDCRFVFLHVSILYQCINFANQHLSVPSLPPPSLSFPPSLSPMSLLPHVSPSHR